MKTRTALILAVILCLCIFMLAGCGSKNTPEEPDPSTPDGAWTVSTEPVSPVIPEEALEAFNDATAELMGAGYEPVAYLGSQVVAGSNYCFLCRATTVTATPETKLCTVKVYCDLEGNSSILDVKDIAISDYTSDSELSYSSEGLAGGWSIPVDSEPAVLPDEVQTAFDNALAGMSGVGYHPIAYLGSQLVAGCNYAILCSATTVTAEPQSALAVVTVYADLNGGAQITSVSGFDFAE